ncbi:TPA: hypothetical protein JBD69_13170, partial [Legionella pneumophila subsp. pneumophila]|nr:hypothetical protein [Legionella pneumophila subsp. pneumophila]
MASSKEEKALVPKDSDNKFGDLPSEVAGNIPSSVTGVLNLIYSSITTHNLFKPYLEPMKARACVVQGDLATLKLIAERNPEALFQKGNITDPRERTFYNVSAWQLIHFLCDADMKNQLMPLIPEQLKSIAQKQMKELGSGGADLIKLSRDPQAVAFEDFKGLTQFKQTFTLYDGSRKEVTFPLLENVDGIFYYQDENKEVHFYYANRETKTIMPLEANIKSDEDKQLFAAFKASFDAMENNSSRRSSDAEHQLIAKLFPCQLHRQGVHYEHHGVSYQDSRTSFNLINAYRKNIRLYDEAAQNNEWEKAHADWREGVGIAQGAEMWLLERICEEGRPFHPLPAEFRDFKRGITFYNWNTDKVESAFTGGKLA